MRKINKAEGLAISFGVIMGALAATIIVCVYNINSEPEYWYPVPLNFIIIVPAAIAYSVCRDEEE